MQDDGEQLWRSFGLKLFLLLIFGALLNWLIPAIIYVPIIDSFMLPLIAFMAIFLSSMGYLHYNSPKIFTEDGITSTKMNVAIPVDIDLQTIPPMMLLPAGGYLNPKVWLGGEDMGSRGIALFVPCSLLERLGQTSIVHGRPMLISTDSVESNKWMTKALYQQEHYEHGKTDVYLVLWGEGPSTDIPYDESVAFAPNLAHKIQSELETDIKSLSDEAVVEMSRKIRTLMEARRSTDAERVMVKVKELTEDKKEEGQ